MKSNMYKGGNILFKSPPIFDDTVIEKQYIDENDLICCHWDHGKARNIKGINLLSTFYVCDSLDGASSLHIQLAYGEVKKMIRFCEIKNP
jgi:hypothetical protein